MTRITFKNSWAALFATVLLCTVGCGDAPHAHTRPSKAGPLWQRVQGLIQTLREQPSDALAAAQLDSQNKSALLAAKKIRAAKKVELTQLDFFGDVLRATFTLTPAKKPRKNQPPTALITLLLSPSDNALTFISAN